MLLYLAQEGRGIGLLNKLRAYKLQEEGLDTVDANLELGMPADLRDYGIGAQILVDLGLTSIRLLTNNPKKIVGLEGYGLNVTDQIPIEHPPGEHNTDYLRAKAQKLGHLLHHQGLALDEEMIQRGADPRPRARRAQGRRAGPRGRARRWLRRTRSRSAGSTRIWPTGSWRAPRACSRRPGRASRCTTCRARTSFRWPRSTAPARAAYAGVACLGAVIRGETDHYDYVCAEAASGIARVSLDTGVPCAFGVLTVDNMEQALARAGGGQAPPGRGRRARGAADGRAASASSAGDVTDTVNLYSDTQTRPTDGMRAAIASAEVADEQRGLDPTVNALQDRVAELLGHEAALFLPTGTMCNEIAFRLHIRAAGDEILCDRLAHPIIAEGGGPAALAGAMINPIDGDGGVFTAEQLEAAIRPESRYMPRSRLVSVEQTTNISGGRVWPLETMLAVLEKAREHGLRTHLDGARLLNAVAASGVPADEWAGGFDTAWIDFSKGLGAPVGAVLAGSEELIAEAWRWKQMTGGAMRQAGIVAAGCLYALDHHVDRLVGGSRERRATSPRGSPRSTASSSIPQTVETNIVIFGVEDAHGLVERIADRVELQALTPNLVRAVTHLDVDRDGIDRALEAFSSDV